MYFTCVKRCEKSVKIKIAKFKFYSACQQTITGEMGHNDSYNHDSKNYQYCKFLLTQQLLFV